MKNRASLVLMEQLIMVMVFALAAAVCVSAFLRAEQISQRTADYDRAVLLAQNGAEVMKACRGDLDQAAGLLGAAREGEILTLWEESHCLEIERVVSGIPGLGMARIRVTVGDNLVYTLETGWQEVGR